MIKKREKKYSAVMYDIANILWIGTADSGYSLRASGNIFSALSPPLGLVGFRDKISYSADTWWPK